MMNDKRLYCKTIMMTAMDDGRIPMTVPTNAQAVREIGPPTFRLLSIAHEQWVMAKGFFHNHVTRTPILIIWVASFGGALHASVTTFFYIEVGASDMDIGRIGFLQCLGGFFCAPLFGYALDHGYPVFGPLIVTATACSLGCLWRGFAASVWDLYVAAILLSIGVSLWTVVLLHVVHSTPREHRSQVLSAFTVQETGLRLLGKAVFPAWDLMVRYVLMHSPEVYSTVLFRYRIHMGICTLFCFFGTVALLVERQSLLQQPTAKEASLASKTSDLEAPTSTKNLEVTGGIDAIDGTLHIPSNCNTGQWQSISSVSASPHPHSSSNFRYFAILSALLIQSWSSTVLTVLWPLVLRDQFQFAATEYGLVVVVASVCSTCAIASFPTVECRLGRMRTAASLVTVASMACLLSFVVIPSLLSHNRTLADAENAVNPDAVVMDDGANMNRAWFARLVPQTFMVHAILAIVFSASVHTLEPSLKSMLSLIVPASAQNRSLGAMSTLGGLGGMVGNLVGTWLFQRSKVISSVAGAGRWLGNGALPFVVVTGVLSIASLFLWALEWDDARHRHNSLMATAGLKAMGNADTGDHQSLGLVATDSPDAGGTTSNSSQTEGVFFPLLHLQTSYEMKLD
jgi:hypothetical protein